METRNITHLADSLKHSIKERTGSRFNIPICEEILKDVFDDLAKYLDKSGKVTLGDFGTFKLELKGSQKVSGNLPQHKGMDFSSPSRVNIIFTPSMLLREKISSHLNKVKKYGTSN